LKELEEPRGTKKKKKGRLGLEKKKEHKRPHNENSNAMFPMKKTVHLKKTN